MGIEPVVLSIEKSMANWFETTVTLERRHEDGTRRSVAETYMVAAPNFSSAEYRILQEVGKETDGEIGVAAIHRARYTEIVTDDKLSDFRFYRIRLRFTVICEKSGRERKKVSRCVFQASSLEDSVKRVREYMRHSMADYEIVDVSESPILDILT